MNWIAKAGLAGGLLLLFTFAVVEIHEPDYWYHLAVGRLVATHPVHTGDEPFAQNPAGLEKIGWHLHEWLYERWMFTLHQHGGPTLVLLWSALLLLTTYGLLYLAL